MRFDNVFHAMRVLQHDEDYEPEDIPQATPAQPGSWAKIEELRRRVQSGERLWNNNDETICVKQRWDSCPPIRRSPNVVAAPRSRKSLGHSD